MLDHISIGVADIATSAKLYDAVVEPLGFRRLYDRADSGDPGLA